MVVLFFTRILRQQMVWRAAILYACLTMQLMSYIAGDCTFSKELDPNTQISDLTMDYNAQSADDCKQACCDDASCDTWQFQVRHPVLIPCMVDVGR